MLNFDFLDKGLGIVSPVFRKDLQFTSDLLDPIMSADDTNLFYSNKDVNTAFLKVNDDELQKINEWLI